MEKSALIGNALMLQQQLNGQRLQALRQQHLELQQLKLQQLCHLPLYTQHFLIPQQLHTQPQLHIQHQQLLSLILLVTRDWLDLDVAPPRFLDYQTASMNLSFRMRTLAIDIHQAETLSEHV